MGALHEPQTFVLYMPVETTISEECLQKQVSLLFDCIEKFFKKLKVVKYIYPKPTPHLKPTPRNLLQ